MKSIVVDTQVRENMLIFGRGQFINYVRVSRGGWKNSLHTLTLRGGVKPIK